MALKPIIAGGFYNSSSATSPGGSSGQVQYNNAGAFGGLTGLTTSGGILQTAALSPPVDTQALGISGYSITGSNAQSMIDLAGTWNTSGAPVALKLTITNTSSGANARLFDFIVGSTSALSLAPNGTLRFWDNRGRLETLNAGMLWKDDAGTLVAQFGRTGGGASGLNIGESSQLGWAAEGSIQDLSLVRKAAATLQMGADAAGVTNQMFTAANRITSDGVGANLTIAPGNGRGAAGGTLILSTFTTAGAATAGTLTSRMTIDTAGAVAFPNVTAVVTEAVVSDRTWPISINGVPYKILLLA